MGHSREWPSFQSLRWHALNMSLIPKEEESKGNGESYSITIFDHFAPRTSSDGYYLRVLRRTALVGSGFEAAGAGVVEFFRGQDRGEWRLDGQDLVSEIEVPGRKEAIADGIVDVFYLQRSLHGLDVDMRCLAGGGMIANNRQCRVDR